MERQFVYRIKITGMVQGVGFRWRVYREALKIGITGYVKNMSDGSVYIEAEGNRGQLENFISWCRQGTGVGFVDSVGISEGPPEGHTAFSIEH